MLLPDQLKSVADVKSIILSCTTSIVYILLLYALSMTKFTYLSLGISSVSDCDEEKTILKQFVGGRTYFGLQYEG